MSKLAASNLLILVLLAATPTSARSDAPALPRKGLYVHDGVLLQSGKPYRGIGVNCFNLFYRTLQNPDDTSYEQSLHRLAEAGIPFVRFACGGYWPADWDLYIRDPHAYFKLLDGVVSAAEKHGIGLIPSLLWTVAIVPDLVGEPVDQLGEPSSKTIAFIRQYTRQVVTRYRHSPAMLAWEFGNEYNLHADLPNAAEHRPPVWPRMKTGLTRSERDDLKAEHMLTAFAEFARIVRSLDPHRCIITGNSVPRSSAWHNWKEKSWKQDTPEQFEEILLRDNPDPFDTISVHLYPEETNSYPARTGSLAELIESIQRCALSAKKPLFIGEFGAPATLGPGPERLAFEELIEAIVRNDVPLSALWVFDYPPQDKDWNVTFENDRAYMLELLVRANARMRGR